MQKRLFVWTEALTHTRRYKTLEVRSGKFVLSQNLFFLTKQYTEGTGFSPLHRLHGPE